MVSNNKKLAFLVLLFAILLILPLLVTGNYYLHLINLVIVYSMITVGLNIITGVTGQVSLGHAAFLGMGAYIAAFITTKVDLSFWLGMLMAIIVSGLFGLIVAWFTLHLEGPYLAMATIGIGEITRQTLINWTAFSGGPSGIYGIPSIMIGGFAIDSETKFYYFGLIFLILIYVVCHRIVFSRIGRALIAIREREGAAKAVGIATTRMKIFAFTLSTMIAGLAGAIYAHWINYISPDSFSFSESLLFLTMIMIGGLGSLPGAILGSGTLVFLSELLRDFEQFRMIIYALLIFAVILFFPEGMIGMLPKKFRGRAQYPQYTENRKVAPLVAAIFPRINKTAGAKLLDTTGLIKQFGGLKAVNKVDFSLETGEIRALIGPNGSGKTTFLNCLAGWYTADGGKIEFQGKDISAVPIHLRAKLGIARTFQNILLFKSMTVLENILVAINGKGKTEKQMVDAAHEILRFVGLLEFAGEQASSLPYGEQRRVEIARALALSPNVLLLDEPAAGMNDKETEELMKLIYRIRDTGITILVVEHDMKLVMGIADRITVFNEGSILVEGTPEEIKAHDEVIEAYLGKGAHHVIG